MLADNSKSNGGVTTKRCVTVIKLLLDWINSFVLRFAAMTVLQQDLSFAIVNRSEDEFEGSEHIEHMDLLALLAIGQEAMTSGNPMLKTKKITASVNANVRYVKIRFMLPI